ncbi:MAG: DUF2508 family protein [Defluviitaleaceae bacterium]|nr:DUF2508 family protein [Defluviitaleaceae bacterium]
MAKTVAYPIGSEAAIPRSHWTIKKYHNKEEAVKVSVKSNELSFEDMEIVAALEEAAAEMAFIHSRFDHITEDLLIDCLIYELKAVSLRHKYFLGLCKEKGIVSGSPGK